MKRRTKREAEGVAAFALWRRFRDRRGRRADGASPGAAGAVAAGASTAISALGRLIALIIKLILAAIVVIIAAGILFFVLDANAHNTIVSNVHDFARSLVGPFANLFKPKDPKLALAINWGIALLVYLIVGGILLRLLAPLMALGGRGRRARRDNLA